MKKLRFGFKPCYKWTTFNTKKQERLLRWQDMVLNLVINGLPSIHYCYVSSYHLFYIVLNLVINGLPSIR